MVAYIWFGVRMTGRGLDDLIGGDWRRPSAIARDLGISISFLVVSNIVLAMIVLLLRPGPTPAVRALFPHGRAEVIAYLVLALTAGICEEVMFRGYLQAQLSAWFRRPGAALLSQGLVFGAAHGYQGPKRMVVIAVYGVLFGLLRNWRRSLRPGMAAHFLQDGLIGVFAGRFIR